MYALVVSEVFASAPYLLMKPATPWGEVSLLKLICVPPGSQQTAWPLWVLTDHVWNGDGTRGPSLLLLSHPGPCRAGLPPWLRPSLSLPRLSCGNFPWQLPRSGLTLGLVSSCGWIFLFEKYFKQLVGKGWRGGKRIINKLVKGRLSKWLGVAASSSLVSGLCPGLGSYQVVRDGEGTPWRLHRPRRRTPLPSQAPLVLAFTVRPTRILWMQEKTDEKELVLQQAGLRLDREKNLISEPIPDYVTQDSVSLQSSTLFLALIEQDLRQPVPRPRRPCCSSFPCNNRSSIFLHPSFVNFLFPFSSALPLRPSGSFLKSSSLLLHRWERSRQQLGLMARTRSPRAAPHADGRFLLPPCWLGRIVETEAHRKAGMGDRLNHRVEQKPSQKETGSKSDAGVESEFPCHGNSCGL